VSAIIIIDNKPTEVSDEACREIMRLRSENAALREILINADELERYSGSDGRRQWGKCSTWLHADDVVITVSAKAFDAIRKDAQP
jgi:hypothetical protein